MTAIPTSAKTPTIGVFDSGFGGLTVLRALIERLPRARYAFLGDTARLPYGSKSRRTIARYAAESAQFLVREQGAEFLVIACNTASALALGPFLDRGLMENTGSVSAFLKLQCSVLNGQFPFRVLRRAFEPHDLRHVDLIRGGCTRCSARRLGKHCCATPEQEDRGKLFHKASSHRGSPFVVTARTHYTPNGVPLRSFCWDEPRLSARDALFNLTRESDEFLGNLTLSHQVINPTKVGALKRRD